MILLLFSQEYIIEGITIKGDLNKYFSYDYIDTTFINYFNETKDIFQFITEINLISYGSPLLLNQLCLKSNSSKNLIFNINGIPVNDPKTGIFDISLIPIETIDNIEIFKTGFTLNEGSMDGLINLNKKIKNKLSMQVGRHKDFRFIFSKEIKDIGFSFYLRDYGGYRKNSSGRIFNFSYIYKNIFLDWTYKKTGLPGPKPSLYIPEFGDSDVYSLYDYEKDYLFILSYNLKHKKFNLLPYISYSKMLPYSKYRDFLNGNIIHETDDYRVYTFGIKYSYEDLFFLSIRYDSIYMKGLDTIWGSKNISFKGSFGFQKIFGKYIVNTGLQIEYDIITQLNHSEFIGFSIKNPLNLYILLTREYRKPSYNELFWPNYSNPELQSEKSREVILGFKFFKYIDISFFKKWIREKISLDENWIPKNLDSVNTTGLNLKFLFDFDYLRINSVLKLINGYEFLNSNRFYLQFIPKKSISVNLFILKEPEIFFSFIYNDNLKKVNFDDVPSYYIFNVGISKNIKNMKFNLSVYNLLNRKYYTNFGYFSGEYYPGEPINIKLNLSTKI